MAGKEISRRFAVAELVGSLISPALSVAGERRDRPFNVKLRRRVGAHAWARDSERRRTAAYILW